MREPATLSGLFLFAPRVKRGVGMFESTKAFDGGEREENLNWQKRVARCPFA
jgi:hypothetical protein